MCFSRSDMNTLLHNVSTTRWRFFCKWLLTTPAVAPARSQRGCRGTALAAMTTAGPGARAAGRGAVTIASGAPRGTAPRRARDAGLEAQTENMFQEVNIFAQNLSLFTAASAPNFKGKLLTIQFTTLVEI